MPISSYHPEVLTVAAATPATLRIIQARIDKIVSRFRRSK